MAGPHGSLQPLVRLMADPSEIRFLADQMLGKLARLLRLLGYNTLYEPGARLERVRELATRGDRVLLTRGRVEERFPEVAVHGRVMALDPTDPPEQLRQVVARFALDTVSGRFTRCTLCNTLLERIDKTQVEGRVPPKVYEFYSEFFACGGCGQLYWQGSHVERILRNLGTILSPP